MASDWNAYSHFHCTCAGEAGSHPCSVGSLSYSAGRLSPRVRRGRGFSSPAQVQQPALVRPAETQRGCLRAQPPAGAGARREKERSRRRSTQEVASAKRTHRNSALPTRGGEEWWLFRLARSPPAKRRNSVRDSGVSAMFRRRAGCCACLCPRREDAARSPAEAAQGGGRLTRKPWARAPGQGPLGSQLCVQTRLSVPRASDLTLPENPGIRMPADAEETSTCGSWGPGASRDPSQRRLAHSQDPPPQFPSERAAGGQLAGA